MNLLTVPLGENGTVSVGGVSVDLPPGARANGSSVVLGFRPESLELGASGVPAKVEVVEELGADAFVFCSADVGSESQRLVARVEARRRPERGERVTLQPRAAEAHVFDADTGERLTDE